MKHSENSKLWQRRFRDVDENFFSSIEEMTKLDIPLAEYIHQFPIFTGHVNISRYLYLYEAFKMVQGMSGNYADVGTWKGASFLFIAKLIKLFEPNVPFQAHAFDWFKGMKPDKQENEYIGSYDMLKRLVDIQKLGDVAVIHEVDLINELDDFDKDTLYSPLYFKYVFMDCGYKEVLNKAVPFFWERLLSGGIMLFDHFGSDIKDETEIVRTLLPEDTILRNFSFARQPMGYVIKQGR